MEPIKIAIKQNKVGNEKKSKCERTKNGSEYHSGAAKFEWKRPQKGIVSIQNMLVFGDENAQGSIDI